MIFCFGLLTLDCTATHSTFTTRFAVLTWKAIAYFCKTLLSTIAAAFSALGNHK